MPTKMKECVSQEMGGLRRESNWRQAPTFGRHRHRHVGLGGPSWLFCFFLFALSTIPHLFVAGNVVFVCCGPCSVYRRSFSYAHCSSLKKSALEKLPSLTLLVSLSDGPLSGSSSSAINVYLSNVHTNPLPILQLLTAVGLKKNYRIVTFFSEAAAVAVIVLFSDLFYLETSSWVKIKHSRLSDTVDL